MFNQTLRVNAKICGERKEILSQHRVLWRRAELILKIKKTKIDLEPILSKIRQQQTEELQKLEQQISRDGDHIQQAQEMVDHQAHEQEMKRQELQSPEQNLLSLRAAAAES